MSNSQSEITHVSDTALLVAACRAIESERPDAFVRDPLAARLAGERGMAMFRALPHPEIMCFGIAIRTRFADELLLEALAVTGVNTVMSVGCGLDTRPWRLALPQNLKWIEVDFSAMLEYKEKLMATESLRCHRECLTADLNDPLQRRRIFAAAGSAPSLMITEGLLMYLSAATVESFAGEARRQSNIAHWICDIRTSSFTKAIGGDGVRVVRHVQADDFLEGEQILECLHRNGWVTGARRTYVADVAFAKERVSRMMGGRQPSTPPPFVSNDPSGVHRFERA